MTEDVCLQVQDGSTYDEGYLNVTNLTVCAGKRTLVDKACFQIPPGSITMCSGLSGSGKSSLLKCLAGRLPAASGSANKDGISLLKVRAHERRTVVAYCSQDPVFCPGWHSLTVKEYLVYVARLQLRGHARLHMFDKIDSLIVSLNLDASAAVLARRSGGEQKRVSVLADVFLSEATTVLLDEATSGLSHIDALRLIQLLNDDAIRGKRVMLAATHQPSIELYDLFATVVLIHAGRVLYCGHRSELKEGAFLNRPLATPDDVSDAMATITKLESERLVRQHTDSFRESIFLPSSQRSAPIPLDGSLVQWLEEYTYLAQHATLLLLKDGSATIATFGFQILESALTGWMFSSPNERSAAAGFSRLYAAARTPTSTYTVTPSLLAWYIGCWRPTSIHEIASGRYGSTSCVLALATASLIRATVLAIPTMTLYYWLSDLYVTAYGWTLVYELSCIVFQCTLMLSLAIICGTVETTMLLYSIFNSAFGFIKGAIVSERSMAPWAQKASFYSPLRWQFQGTASAQLSGRNYQCTDREENVYDCPVSGGDILAQWDLRNFDQWKLALLLPACSILSIVVVCIRSSTALQGVAKISQKKEIIAVESPEPGRISSEVLEQIHREHSQEGITNLFKHSTDSMTVSRASSSYIQTSQDAATLCIDTFSVLVKKTKKVLVDRVSLEAKPGSITAILGLSGSGKTCLIRGLASCLDFAAVTTGKVTFKINHEMLPAKQTDFALVSQHDCISGFMSVEEHIRYAAALAGTDATRVLKLAHALGLEGHLMHLRCQHLSGGEARRVSLCVDGLVRSDARVLLGDEITTGLSATDVLKLAVTIRHLADIKKHLVILISAHTPRRELFECFDTLVLLRRGGKLAYCGPRLDIEASYTDEDEDANFAEVLLERLDETAKFEEKPLCNVPMKDDINDDDGTGSSLTERKYRPERYFWSRWRHVPILFVRFVRHAAREPGLTVIPAVESLVVSTILGLVCYQIKVNAESARDVVGIFFLLTFTIFMISTMSWPAYLDLENQIRHEVRLYKIDAVAALFPFALVNIIRIAIVRALLVVLPVYILAGLSSHWRAQLYAYLAMLVASLSGFVIMLMAISITGSRDRAVAVVSILTFLANVNGFQRAVNDLPPILRFISKHANPLYFVLDAAVTAQLPSTLDCPASPSDGATVFCPLSKNDYLRTVYSYGIKSPRNRMLHAFTVLAGLYITAIAIFTWQLHLPRKKIS